MPFLILLQPGSKVGGGKWKSNSNPDGGDGDGGTQKIRALMLHARFHCMSGQLIVIFPKFHPVSLCVSVVNVTVNHFCGHL
jgi:hypothetical protein